jgi:hypothetical protein
MTKNTTPYLLQNDVYVVTSFLNADGTTVKDICSAGTDGSYVYELQITSSITTTRDITIYLSDGTNDIPIKLITVGITQGTVIGSPNPLRLIQDSAFFIPGRLLERDQNYYIPLPTGWKLRMKANVAITSGQEIKVVAHRKDF